MSGKENPLEQTHSPGGAGGVKDPGIWAPASSSPSAREGISRPLRPQKSEVHVLGYLFPC